MLTDHQIIDACLNAGSKAVYDAAHARIAGDHLSLPAVGLPDVPTLGDAWHIAQVAFGRLSDDDCAADLADVTIKAVSLRGGVRKGAGRKPSGLTERVEVRVTGDEKAKLARLGGSEWVREQIKRARERD